MTGCSAFTWCENSHPNHVEHTWAKSVLGKRLSGKQLRIFALNSIQDGYGEPLMVGIDDPNGDDDYGAEIWLTIEEAAQLRDAIVKAIENSQAQK